MGYRNVEARQIQRESQSGAATLVTPYPNYLLPLKWQTRLSLFYFFLIIFVCECVLSLCVSVCSYSVEEEE